jgi:hypothetical protein
MSAGMTAKVRLASKMPFPGADYTQLNFYPDYQDGRNNEWATATPSLTLTMNVKNEVADRLESQAPYTLTFTQEEDAAPQE